jgi:hypothetical protein
MVPALYVMRFTRERDIMADLIKDFVGGKWGNSNTENGSSPEILPMANWLPSTPKPGRCRQR